MDWRWSPISRDSKRQVKIILHPTAAIYEVRRGMDPGSDDSIDLSEFVKDANHTAFEAHVTLVFNRELFGAYQPKPLQVLEIQLYQNKEWKPLWLGHIDSISSFTMQRGERQMQLIAKTREQHDIWKNTPRVSPMYPQLTNLTYIAQRVARTTDMKGDEIVLPPSSITTAHSNTQLADMSAWDMISAIFVSLGWTPFIDGQGRLRAADRGLLSRVSDVKLTDDRMVKVGGQRQRPPVNRVRVTWLSPELRIWKQTGRLLSTWTGTLGWWLPVWHETIKYSTDETLRASKTYIFVKKDINTWFDFITWKWEPQTATKGKLTFHNKNFGFMIAAITAWSVAHLLPDPVLVAGIGVSGGVTVPEEGGGTVQMYAMLAYTFLMMNIGTGTYEVWGQPYDFVHAKNVSEAFDSSVPVWVNNVMDIQCDFIINEAHAQAVAIRELIYTAQSANKWSVTIVDDPRVEYGDILEFPDESQLFVEDFNRPLGRGSEATLEIKGFLVGKARGGGKSIAVGGGTPDIGVGAPGQPGGGPEGPAEGTWDGVMGTHPAHPIIAMSADVGQIRADVQRSYDHYHPIGMAHVPPNEIGSVDMWVGYADHVGDKFSNGKYYLGWNLYWESRMESKAISAFDQGSGNPEDGSLPAKY